MSDPEPADLSCSLYRSIWPELLQVAFADSRLGHDFSAFYPDFRDSSHAIDAIVKLDCYKTAKTIFIASDNALQELRYRALQDGKKILVNTHVLRRGFVLLDPRRISEDRFEVASLLEGMEKRGIGQKVEMAQFKEDVGRIDLCVTGAFAVDTNGTRFGNGQGIFDLAFGTLFDRNVIDLAVSVIAVVHSCQVIDKRTDNGVHLPRKPWDIPCDFIASPERLLDVTARPKPDVGIMWEKLSPGQLESISDLQELKGIQMMEKIMRGMGSFPEELKPTASGPTEEELKGIRMMEQIMKGYKS